MQHATECPYSSLTPLQCQLYCLHDRRFEDLYFGCHHFERGTSNLEETMWNTLFGPRRLLDFHDERLRGDLNASGRFPLSIE
jgi:hypothetical protein